MPVLLFILCAFLLVIVAYAVWRFEVIGFRVKLPFTEVELTGRNPRKRLSELTKPKGRPRRGAP